MEYLVPGRVGPVASKKIQSPINRVGGKYYNRNWILANMPRHKIYVEPFFGAGHIFFAKAKAKLETINDKDKKISSLFKTIRDYGVEEIERRISWTEFGRDSFAEAVEIVNGGDDVDPVLFSWAIIYVSLCGYSGKFSGPGDFGARSFDVGMQFVLYNRDFRQIFDRLVGVQVENRDAVEVIEKYGVEGAVVYCDPPYVRSTRKKEGKVYDYEMSDSDHERFLKVAVSSPAMVMVSGYDSELYRDVLETDAGWMRLEKNHVVVRGNMRIVRDQHRVTEVLWVNEGVVDAVKGEQPTLFG